MDHCRLGFLPVVDAVDVVLQLHRLFHRLEIVGAVFQ